MPKPASPRAPSDRRGYVVGADNGLGGWGVQHDQFETVAELLWPSSIGVYRRMGTDSRAASVLQALSLPVRRTDWRIDPNGARDEVVDLIATDLGLRVIGADESLPTQRQRNAFSWSEHLRLALKCLQYGHAVFESQCRVKQGRARLWALWPRPQSTIAHWHVDRDGQLVGVEQWPAGLFVGAGMTVQVAGPTSGMIPGSSLVAYARDAEPGLPIGESVLRPAYAHWLLKSELMRIEAAAIRRHGIGVPVAHTPPEADGDEDEIERYRLLASEYTGGSSAGVGLPSEAKLAILSPAGTPLDPRRAIEYHDHQMAIASLAHFLNLDGKGGSYALASVQARTFVDAVSVVADMIRDTAQRAVVERLVTWNFGDDEPAPRLVYDALDSRQESTAAALQLLVNAGLLTPDQRLESYVREAAGLPVADPATARERVVSTAPMPAAEDDSEDDGGDDAGGDQADTDDEMED